MKPKLGKTPHGPNMPDVYVRRCANGFFVEPWSGYPDWRNKAHVFTDYHSLAVALTRTDGGRSFLMEPDDGGSPRQMFRTRSVTECIKILKTKHPSTTFENVVLMGWDKAVEA